MASFTVGCWAFGSSWGSGCYQAKRRRFVHINSRCLLNLEGEVLMVASKGWRNRVIQIVGLNLIPKFWLESREWMIRTHNLNFSFIPRSSNRMARMLAG